MKTLSLLLPILFFLVACSVPFDDLKLTGDGLPKLDSGPFDRSRAGAMVINFETVKQLAIGTCVKCHAGGNLDLTQAATVVAKRTEILGSINRGAMPPKTSGMKSLNACEKQILETWIDDQVAGRTQPTQRVSDLSQCGDFKADPVKEPTDLTKLEPTFENVKLEILSEKCLACHNNVVAKKKTNLESLAAIIAKDEFITNNPNDSKLVKRVLLRGQGQMPTVKSGIPVLTEQQVEFLRRWIKATSDEIATSN